MANSNITNNQRIAKNTILLYIRTFFVMIISLFTSRVVLQALGVDNFGIQSAVGGVIGLFSIISGSLSASISRFITFELGKEDKLKLHKIFCTSVNIQILISIVVLILAETIGVWFLNSQMNIPDGRMAAANWVFQGTILSFIIGLLSVPYNACIIGHEKMSIFAYISIVEAVLRLIVAYLLFLSPTDKLVTFAVLSVVVAFVIRVIYAVYCKRTFEECTFRFIYDNNLLKEMFGFAGWSFLSNIAWVLNTQGINIIINIFFGVTVNAAIAVVTKADGALKQFTTNFTTAIQPQIMKSYAAGEKEECFQLIGRGARFSYFLMLLMALPLMFEAPLALDIWLDEVPPYSVPFFRLSIVVSLIMLLGDSGYRACMATGNIKKYTLVITSITILTFPSTWISFKLGYPPTAAYIINMLVYASVNIVRLFLMKELLGYPPIRFVKDVFVRVVVVTIVATLPPLLLKLFLAETILSSIVIILVGILSTALSIYTLGVTRKERTTIHAKIDSVIKKIKS